MDVNRFLYTFDGSLGTLAANKVTGRPRRARMTGKCMLPNYSKFESPINKEELTIQIKELDELIRIELNTEKAESKNDKKLLHLILICYYP